VRLGNVVIFGYAMPCRHPLGARQVIARAGRLETACWACAVERAPGVCGATMPMYGETCARRAGHGHEHRTRYAMDNARDRKRRAA
jgi:hypothetical protein